MNRRVRCRCAKHKFPQMQRIWISQGARKRSRGASNARRKSRERTPGASSKGSSSVASVPTPSSASSSARASSSGGTSSRPRLSFCGLLVVVGTFAWLATFVYNCTVRVGHWRNREVLFAVDTAAWPRSLKSHHQLGTVYHRENRSFFTIKLQE